ncbi:hypothetical protein E2C01_008363 [Portunus trituberculatus]|uniref:Uncharacterized protein n=1 Tax=Portunus trituberculatus TaxID=210409 RepID=A0A5B7D0L9_PORTR|nr:hypothetical protein [Portunus trituberculatus]
MSLERFLKVFAANGQQVILSTSVHGAGAPWHHQDRREGQKRAGCDRSNIVTWAFFCKAVTYMHAPY